MIDPGRPPERRVVLSVRQHASAALVERVRRLEADGVAAVAVTTWGPVTPALEAGRIDRFATLRAIARERDGGP